jgi:hypothetical protein
MTVVSQLKSLVEAPTLASVSLALDNESQLWVVLMTRRAAAATLTLLGEGEAALTGPWLG